MLYSSEIDLSYILRSRPNPTILNFGIFQNIGTNYKAGATHKLKPSPNPNDPGIPSLTSTQNWMRTNECLCWPWCITFFFFFLSHRALRLYFLQSSLAWSRTWTWWWQQYGTGNFGIGLAIVVKAKKNILKVFLSISQHVANELTKTLFIYVGH